jgi:Flp pilus assembly protein TadG
MARSNLISRIKNDKRGNVAITLGLAIVPAVMFIGGAVDFGNAYRTKQRVQAAADAAVLAAASMPHGTSDAARQARAVGIFNANMGGNSGITPNASASGNTITLTAQGAVNTSFLKIANINSISVNGSASGSVDYTTGQQTTTTTGYTNGKLCLLALDPAAPNGMISQGTPNINYQDCWAHTNSTSANAIAGGGSAQVVGQGHSAVGGIQASANAVYSPTPVGGRAAVADPFATVSAYTLPYSSYQSTFTPPAIPSACKASGLNLKKNTFTLEPGRYCGGINMQAQATVHLQPGVYIIDNGIFNVQSGSKITGTDVLLYFVGPNARFTVIGGGIEDLKGRTSGPDDLKGFLFIAHPNAWRGLTSNIQGGGSFRMEGMIYAPTQNIIVTGNGDANGSSNFFAIVAKSFEFRGNGIYRFKHWNAASNMPNLMPNLPIPTTTTTTTSTQVLERVRLK